MKKICIYHANCADGFTAAWAVWKKFGADVEFYPGVYQNDPPNCTGLDVIFVDFCYKLPQMQRILEQCNSLLILDHHKTAKETLDALQASVDPADDRNKLGVVFDLNRSGAGIAWDHFHGVQRPALVDYVEDRDLWRFNLVWSREINANIFSHPYTFGAWDEINIRMRGDESRAIFAAEGGAIERKHHKDVAELVETFKRRMLIGGHNVWVANIPYTLTSDAGHLMAQGEAFAACYWDTPEGRVFSLRSTDDGLDVSVIASQYGGGGHRNAAGFRLDHGVEP